MHKSEFVNTEAIRLTSHRLIILIMLIISFPIFISSQTVEQGYVEYKIYKSDNTCTLTNAKEYFNKVDAKEFVVPDTIRFGYEFYKVVAIGERAFSSCSSLSSVKLPNSLLMIGERAFSDCSSLSSVELPNSLLTIGVSY